MAITLFRRLSRSFAQCFCGGFILLLSFKNWLCILVISPVLFRYCTKKNRQEWPVSTRTGACIAIQEIKIKTITDILFHNH